MDKTFIRDLKAHVIIGVYDFERIHPQPLSFDIEMTRCLRKAGKTDDLNEAINYAAVSEDVISLAKSLQPQLLETLAEAITTMILTKYHAETVTLKISKPDAVAAAAAVGVEITRTQADLEA